MRLFVFTLAFAALASAQSFHIIRVIPSGATPGTVVFCGDSTHATACQSVQANAAGTLLDLPISDININSASANLTIVNGAAGGEGINMQTNGANASITVVNAHTNGSGVGATVANNGTAIIGTNSGTGFAGLFTATGGTGLFATSTSGGLAAEFGTGNVKVDHNLLVGASFGLTSAGVLTVSSCTGCGGGVTSFNTRNGAVTLLAADITAAAQDIQTSANPTFALGTFTNGISVGGAGSSFNINSASDTITIVNSGSGIGVNMSTAGANASITVVNSNTNGSGVAATVANNGTAIIGVNNGTGAAGAFTATGGSGITATSTSGGLAAHFLTGNVTIDNNLNATGGIVFGTASNSYFRTFSGAPSCVAVTDGWFGFDTSLGILYICNGGVATVH